MMPEEKFTTIRVSYTTQYDEGWTRLEVWRFATVSVGVSSHRDNPHVRATVRQHMKHMGWTETEPYTFRASLVELRRKIKEATDPQEIEVLRTDLDLTWEPYWQSNADWDFYNPSLEKG